MRKFAAALAVVVFATSSALGGVVSFNNGVEPDLMPGDMIDMPVVISAADFAGFNSVGLVIASTELEILDFVYHPDFIGAVTPIPGESPRPPSPFDPPRFPLGSELFIGGISFIGDTMAAPMNMGTVTVGADQSLALGSYEVFVSTARDGGASSLTSATSGTPEAVEGSIFVNVPEPATISLLAFGALALIRRRKSA